MSIADITFPEDTRTRLVDTFDKKVHIRVQQRSAKKYITVIEGLEKDVSAKALKDLKTRLGCIGTLKNDTIQFSGDQRDKVYDYLVDKNVVEEDSIVLHGF